MLWSLLLLLACGSKDPADRDGYSPIDDTAPGPIDSGGDSATDSADSGTTGEPIVYTAIPGASLECDSATTEALLVSAPAAGSLSVIHAAAMSGGCPTGFSAALVKFLKTGEPAAVNRDPLLFGAECEGVETPDGTVIIASCKKEEESFEWIEKRQGIFTFWLCKALEGGADQDGDGQLSEDEFLQLVEQCS